MTELMRPVGTGDQTVTMNQQIERMTLQLDRRVCALEHAAYDTWILDPSCPYAQAGKHYAQEHQNLAQQNKGKGVALGHVSGYILLGILRYYTVDPLLSTEDKATMKDLLAGQIGQAAELDITKMPRMNSMIKHCQVLITKNRKAFIIISFYPMWTHVEQSLFAALSANGGQYQYDAQRNSGLANTIRIAQEQKGKGGRGGKGYKA